MMTHTNSLGTINQTSEVSIPHVISVLSARGLQVDRSFDLQIAREAHGSCTCPHHGTKKCSCQIVVLLVYSHKEGPVTLVAHGRDGRTRFALANHSDDDFSIPIVEEIRQLIRGEDSADSREDPSHDG